MRIEQKKDYEAHLGRGGGHVHGDGDKSEKLI